MHLGFLILAPWVLLNLVLWAVRRHMAHQQREANERLLDMLDVGDIDREWEAATWR